MKKIRFPEKRYGVVPTNDFQFCLQRWIFDATAIDEYSKFLCNRSIDGRWETACESYLQELSNLNDGTWSKGFSIHRTLSNARLESSGVYELITRDLRLNTLDWLAAYFGEPKNESH